MKNKTADRVRVNTYHDPLLRARSVIFKTLILGLILCIYSTLGIALPSALGLEAAHAATYTIRGVVTSHQGKPLAKANVKIIGTSKRVQSDRRGRFKLKTSRSGRIELITILNGYQTDRRSITLTERFTDITIKLKKRTATPGLTGALSQDHSRFGGGKSARIVASPPSTRAHNRARRPSKSRSRSRGGRKSRPSRKQTLRRAKRLGVHPRAPEAARGDEYRKINENDYQDPRVNPLSTLSIDVDTASYANMRRFIQNGKVPPVDAVKIEEMINYFDYHYTAPQEGDSHPFKTHTELAEAPWNPRHKLLRIGLQGKRIKASNLPPSNLVFLLDVSGSMRGSKRLPLLKQALTLLSGTLRPQDKVSIVVYAGAAGVVLPPTSGSRRHEIIEAFSKLSAGGSTAGGAGIKLAYQLAQDHFIKGGNNRVILATDGDFNVGTSSQAELVRLIERKRKSGVFLTVLGFGRGNYRASTMSDLAEKGNGNHAYIDSILEAQKVLVSEMGGTLFTIAKDVKIQVEFNPAKVGRYRLIGYQSRLLAARDFNDDTKDAGELGAGHNVTALYELIPPGEVQSSSPSVDPLKYQKRTAKPVDQSSEWLTVKLRYKKPAADKSVLVTHTHRGDRGDWREASQSFRFAAGVAEFGMLLRDSKHLGSSAPSERVKQWSHTLKVIKGARGADEQGYRAELLDLIERARVMKLK